MPDPTDRVYYNLSPRFWARGPIKFKLIPSAALLLFSFVIVSCEELTSSRPPDPVAPVDPQPQAPDQPQPEPAQPIPVGALNDMNLTVGDAPVSVDVAGNFSDPDSEDLDYSAVSSDPMVLAATVDGSRVTVRATSQGDATVTVTAVDEGGRKATLEFSVSVAMPEPEPVAPVAVGTISSVVMVAGDAPAMVDVSENFQDPDGQELTISAMSDDEMVATVSVSGPTVTVMAVQQGSTTITVTATDVDDLTATLSFGVTVEPPPEPPVPTGTISDLTLTAGDSRSFDLDRYFDDADGQSLRYSVRSANEGVVTASVSGSTVTVTSAAGGTATITVTATDEDGLAAEQRFGVVVRRPAPPPPPPSPQPTRPPDPPPPNPSPAQGPVTVGVIDDRDLAWKVKADGLSGHKDTIPAGEYFDDPDDQSLKYTVSSSAAEVVSAEASGSMVTVTAVSEGEAEVTVTATDEDGLSVSQSLRVVVPRLEVEVVGNRKTACSTIHKHLESDVRPAYLLANSDYDVEQDHRRISSARNTSAHVLGTELHATGSRAEHCHSSRDDSHGGSIKVRINDGIHQGWSTWYMVPHKAHCGTIETSEAGKCTFFGRDATCDISLSAAPGDQVTLVMKHPLFGPWRYPEFGSYHTSDAGNEVAVYYALNTGSDGFSAVDWRKVRVDYCRLEK